MINDGTELVFKDDRLFIKCPNGNTVVTVDDGESSICFAKHKGFIGMAHILAKCGANIFGSFFKDCTIVEEKDEMGKMERFIRIIAITDEAGREKTIYIGEKEFKKTNRY